MHLKSASNLAVGEQTLSGVDDVLEQILRSITAFEQLNQGRRLRPKRSVRSAFMEQGEQGLPGSSLGTKP